MRKSTCAVVFGFFLFTLVSGVCFAQDCKIGTFPIPLMVESKDKGVFIDLTKELAKRAGVSVEIVVAPPPRTIQNFQEDVVDCIFPGLDVTMPKAYSRSSSVYIKRDFAFYKKGNALTSLSELEGKTVGITRGYPYVMELTENKKIKLDFANDDVSNMKKLAMGRIDAFVVEEKSGLKALQDSGVSGIDYNKDKALSEQEVFFAFQKTADGASLAAKFSKAIDEIKEDGTMGKIFSKAQ